ncbi:uncharacterized protein [Prorops nasuta]|uniref:uncharacterized protein isoform X2 n=1 Tax=Prorops nasuta TaxID=863751 RepID=UPI0034CD6DB5
MCDQTEIEYPDGDIVWVKLGAFWWPGKVTGFENLPEDIQREFQKKPLIAAVKFFQEDTYEFVKSYQQIYKYNCSLKEEFIKKGLDKFRSKSKDGTSYMDKFPGDVEMAEKLTGGDPDILNDDRFNPEEKPDISSLFGEKKIPKKKKDRDDMHRRSEGSELVRRITHPRFQRGESDHEVRIRQQPSSLPSTPNNSSSPQYPCHLCNFTASRVNVIICHIKSHRSGDNSPMARSKVKTYSQTRGRVSDPSTPKRKYVRREKNSSGRNKSENRNESGKRKQVRQLEKTSKKKKTDPELREKLLADWEDESDDDVNMDTSVDNSSLSSPLKKDIKDDDESSKDADGSGILAETERLLKETDSLLRGMNDSKSNESGYLKNDLSKSKKEKENASLDTETKTDKDDKKSRLACFDFDEDDVPEPSIPPVRKIPRVFGEKNLSLKKEMIREFEKSQALKTEQEKEAEKAQSESKNDLSEQQEREIIGKNDVITDTELLQAIDSHKREMQENKLLEKSNEGTNQAGKKGANEGKASPRKEERTSPSKEGRASPRKEERASPRKEERASPRKEEKASPRKEEKASPRKEEKASPRKEEKASPRKEEKVLPKKEEKAGSKICETELEIVEIFEVEREEDEEDQTPKTQQEDPAVDAKATDKADETEKISGIVIDKSKTVATKQTIKSNDRLLKETDDTLSENLTTETEDETVSESVPEQSEASDIDMISNVSLSNSDKDNQRLVKRRRGRPRKNFGTTSTVPNKNDISLKSPRILEAMETERKTSESDTERSYTGRKRKPNKKYLESDIYVQSSDQKSLKTDESLSESDDRPSEKPRGRGRRGRKPGHKKKLELKDQIQDLELELSDQFLGSADDGDLSKIHRNKIKGKKFVGLEERLIVGRRSHDTDDEFEESEGVIELPSGNKADGSLVEKEEIEKNGITEEVSTHSEDKPLKIAEKDVEVQRMTEPCKVEMLPPKKSQIKKFELSQIDFFVNDTAEVKATADLSEKDKSSTVITDAAPQAEQIIEMKTESLDKEAIPKTVIETQEQSEDLLSKRSPMTTRYKGKFTPETGAKLKKDKEGQDEKSVNTFQEAFLKTLHMDKKKMSQEEIEAIIGKAKKGKNVIGKKKADEIESTSQESQSESTEETVGSENVSMQIEESVSNISLLGGYEGVEVVVEENIEIDPSTIATVESAVSPFQPESKSLAVGDCVKAISIDVPKIDEPPKASVSAASPSCDINVPVKKREMPRIIESVTLKEPMQILKTKLLDKLPAKGVKHKLEQDSAKKGSPRSKMMKVERVGSNSKSNVTARLNSPTITLTKKLQVLKAGDVDVATQILEVQNEKLNIQAPQTLTTATVTEKYIQQSSQSLADMDLDINSMPFVLSEDVLTPEAIEQMPVVISSIIPASSSISLTPAPQIATTNQAQHSQVELVTSPKKKSGTPAILKNKSKAKPTITSIKTIVPPLTGGVKGLKFQNTQPVAKTSPLLIQKNPPGKYVVVTAGGQQLRYSVQGKSSPPQKIAIPGAKTTGNVQVVQQGGKVVILNQSGQSKMLPLNITKTLGGKVQKIVTSKGQIYCPISPQGQIITSKAMIAPKSDVGSPTTSKLPAGHKIINTQGIITSKGVLTPITGSMSGKTTLLGTVSQGILTKGGIYTPISALSGKTIIGSKALVTKGKTILTTQSIVGPKGTVLTPITGQQVKAIAAKSPVKSAKVQYQNVQQKVQLPVLQKSPKSSSPTVQARATPGAAVKSGGTLVFQNTAPGPKTTTPPTKKLLKQTIVQQGSPVRAATAQTMTQQTVVQQKGKVVSSPSVQKVVASRGRQSKAQQKIVVQKIQEPVVSTVQSIQSRQIKSSPSSSPKILTQQKQILTGTANKPIAKTQVIKGSTQQKNVLSAALNSIAMASVNTNLPTSMPLPPLEPIEPRRVSETIAVPEETVKKEQPKVASIIEKTEVGKVEEPKVATQPQIMALPTESSDGTQTYVLVTIDEQGQIQPLDNNTLMSLEGTTQNPDGTRTLYIDPSSLGEAGTLDNIVLQFDNGMSNVQTGISEPSQTVMAESFPATEIIQTSNQDILAAALANTDFQQEISLPESQATSVMSTGLTQTSLINQTILQSTIIPPTEPISSPSVLETSLTLNQPIMTPLEVPSNLPIQSEKTSTSLVSTIPSSLELPITITNPSISYISSTGEAQIQIAGSSMPDIGEIMETSNVATTSAEIPASTQYLVIPNLEESIVVDSQAAASQCKNISAVTYSVAIPNNIVLDTTQAQTTPSMPIIDDSYVEEQYVTTVGTSEENFVDVPVSEMLVSKAPVASTETVQSQEVTVTSEIAAVEVATEETCESLDKAVSIEETVVATVEEEDRGKEETETNNCNTNIAVVEDGVSNTENIVNIELPVQTEQPLTSSMPIIEDGALVTSDSNSVMQVEDCSTMESCQEADAVNNVETASSAMEIVDADLEKGDSHVVPVEQPISSMTEDVIESMEVSETSNIYPSPNENERQTDEPTSQEESTSRITEDLQQMVETPTEGNLEAPSQSYEQFEISIAGGDSADLPSQSASKSENSREPSQSIAYEPMEIDEETASTEPPTQSFEHSKTSEASQSYDACVEENTNAPTQSFNEIMQSQDERVDEAVDDPNFPTQSYEVGKLENVTEKLETDAEINEEGNIPSQSNDIGADGIGTSSITTNNSGLNEDETASSSYVPETPENQERDQDQESAISTSSYEIPPCEELNIASSSVIPDTSVRAEHTSIHDNGVPEIPTSSYNLNPDITSTHVDSVPSSSYEDQVVVEVEQNVSTSYEVPISMPGLDENSSQNFVTESTDHRNEPSSYYAHQEVTASYYESVDQDANSRLEEDAQEEVTPSYYEGNPQEASQSYFAPEEATPSYTSPSYYDPRPESEASQSYYSNDDLDKTEQSSTQNTEASQSFYQERTDELRLRQQGEATPTYSERYPVDYPLDNSPIERHDLVESSVPATRSMER